MKKKINSCSVCFIFVVILLFTTIKLYYDNNRLKENSTNYESGNDSIIESIHIKECIIDTLRVKTAILEERLTLTRDSLDSKINNDKIIIDKKYEEIYIAVDNYDITEHINFFSGQLSQFDSIR